MVSRTNFHAGSNFDGFSKEQGIFEVVQARALKRALVEQLEDAKQSS